MNPEPRIINTDKVEKDTTYEPPLMIAWGVDESTTGTKTITMGRTIIPPGGRNQRHYHANCDAAFFVRKGTIKVFIGDEKKEYIVPENHIVFSPAGGIHGLLNMSNTDAAELIFTYGNCPSRQAAGTVFTNWNHLDHYRSHHLYREPLSKKGKKQRGQLARLRCPERG